MIELEIQGGVATATLNRPQVNALNPDWVERFGQVLDAVETAGDVRVVRLRSALAVFCAGADLAFMAEHFDRPEGRLRIMAFVRALQGVLSRLEALTAVSIAQIDGPAMGGGFELALACDFRMLSGSARVGFPEARLGLLPGAGGTQRLSRIAGTAVARRMILTAKSETADQALRLGICDWVVPPAEIESQSTALATRIASFPGNALAASKRCLAAALDPGTDGFELELEQTSALLPSQTTQERVRAFLEGNAERG